MQCRVVSRRVCSDSYPKASGYGADEHFFEFFFMNTKHDKSSWFDGQTQIGLFDGYILGFGTGVTSL
jgi:hypothetical protein